MELSSMARSKIKILKNKAKVEVLKQSYKDSNKFMSNAFFDKNIKSSIQIQLSWRYKSYSERFLSAIILFSFCRSFSRPLHFFTLCCLIYIFCPRDLGSTKYGRSGWKESQLGSSGTKALKRVFFPRYIGWLPRFFQRQFLFLYSYLWFQSEGRRTRRCVTILSLYLFPPLDPAPFL